MNKIIKEHEHGLNGCGLIQINEVGLTSIKTGANSRVADAHATRTRYGAALAEEFGE